MGMKNDISSALALHKSMACSGETPSEVSNLMFSDAMDAVSKLPEDMINIVLAVESVNFEIEEHYEKLGYYERDSDRLPTPCLDMRSDGAYTVVMFEGFVIWSSQDDERDIGEGNDVYEPLRPFLKSQVSRRLKTLHDMPF